ncbi:MAG: hypothetical protein KIS67_20265 [Verrucomicrobiae bacterium]|nr:hypothetical protein [Verrucomicrobiae bacterium]
MIKTGKTKGGSTVAIQETTSTQYGAADQGVLSLGGGTTLGTGASQITAATGATINFQDLDAEFAASALGIQREVLRDLADYGVASLDTQAGAVREAFDFGHDLSADAFGFGGEALDFGREAVGSVSQAQRDAVELAESTNVTLAKALESFGTELSSVTERTTLAAQTGGASELTKGLTTGALIAGVLGAIYLFTRK